MNLSSATPQLKRDPLGSSLFLKRRAHVTFTFTLSKKAHWRALRDVTKRTLVYKWSVAFFGGAPILIALYIILRIPDPGYYLLANLAVILGGPLLLLVGFPAIHYLNVSSMHKNSAVLGKPQAFELTPALLIMRGPLHNAEIKWGAVIRVVETAHSFLFYISKNAAHFLPKEAVGAPELPVLRKNLAEWMPGRVQTLADTPGSAAA